MTLNKSEIVKDNPDMFTEGFFANSFFKDFEDENVVIVGCNKIEFLPAIGLKETRKGVFEILCRHKKEKICSITGLDCKQEFEVEAI